MTYSIEFYNAAVLAEVEESPGGINASFTRIAELKTARKRLKEVQGGG